MSISPKERSNHEHHVRRQIQSVQENGSIVTAAQGFLVEEVLRLQDKIEQIWRLHNGFASSVPRGGDHELDYAFWIATGVILEATP